VELSIVVPAYDEEANLFPLAQDLQCLMSGLQGETEMLIVNDNSSDRTGQIANSLASDSPSIRAIHRYGNNGMGNALTEGTLQATGSRVVWVMADRSDDLQTIPKMMEKIDEGCDIVFGSRYMSGGSSGDLVRLKAFGSSGYSRLARLVFGMDVHDITNAFRAFRRTVFTSLQITSADFAISPEFAIKAQMAGFRLGEVPTTYADRRAGKSKFGMVKMGFKYLGLLRYRFS